MLSAAIEKIYDSAVDQSAWLDAVDICAEASGACSAALFSIDTLKDQPLYISALSAHIRELATPDKLKYWMTELAQYDLDGHKRVCTHPLHAVVHDFDLWPENPKLDDRADYLWLAKNVGIRRKIVARLTDNPRYIENFALHFPVDVDTVPTTTVKTMEQLIPHIAKSTDLSRMFFKLRHQYAATLAAINHVGIGICVLDYTGAVVFSNAEASRIADDSKHIELSNGVLKITSNEARRLFEHSVRMLQTTESPPRSAETMIALRDTPLDEPVILELSPVRDYLGELDGPPNLLLAQFVDMSSHRHCSITPFQLAYELSAAEAEVAELLITGMTYNEIADHRDKSLETIRSQVKNILAKANCKTRVDLIRLILKTNPPILAEQ